MENKTGQAPLECALKKAADAASLRAQTSLEFLFAVTLALLILTLSVLVFVQSQADVTALSGAVEAKRICHAVAGQISAVASGGDGTAAVLRRPDSIYAGNYTLYVTSSNRSLSVSYKGMGGGCSFITTGVSNGTSGRFYINGDVSMRNVNGVVVIG